MSIVRPILNSYLRLIEKPRMAHARGIDDIRKTFERNARIFFHASRGTKMTNQVHPGGCDTLCVSPNRRKSDLVIFYIHGGGFFFGSPETHSAMVSQLAARLAAPVIMPRYRLAPEAPYPAAIDDVMSAYLGLIQSGTDPSNIIVGGDSAGGTLAFNLLGQIIANHWPVPRGVFSFSPFADFSHQGASFRENAAREAVLSADSADQIVKMYVAGADQDDPKINPLNTSYTGAPPVWICVGDTEILRDDSRRLRELLTDQHVAVTYNEEHDLPHVWPIFHNILPEARQTLDDLADWIRALPSTSAEN